MPEGPITHFSYSQVNTYLTCPLRYRFQYEEFFEVRLAREVPPFQGYIDLVEEDQKGGSPWLT